MPSPEKSSDKPEMHIPLETVVEWLNERSQGLEKESQDLRAYLARNPADEADLTVRNKFADLGGQKSVLVDFAGFIIGKSAEMQGLLNDPSTLFGERPLLEPDQEVDKA